VPPLPPAVYHADPAGKVTKIAEGIARPNGLMLSPDEKTLYVNDTAGESMLAFDVAASGATSNRRAFAKYPTVTTGAGGALNSGADGLAVDAEGRLYCAAQGGVHVFSRTGELLGTIPISLQPQNLAFAGPDKRTLYIVGRGSAFKVRLLSPGFAGRAK
jgi:gluconolactonase